MAIVTLTPSRARTVPVQTGFTLMELLLVIAIAGITLGLASLSLGSNDSRALQDDARRVAALMQLASDEAILQNRPILFEADAQRYRFLVRRQGAWSPLAGDDLLRGRMFSRPPVTLRAVPNGGGDGIVRIVFEPRPVGMPFLLSLSANAATAGIRADGLGHYTVE
ncbi:MAG TPA: type II secretion system minor pseudopilin GspH [Oxalicibacterium sp.]|nr:type II secretion system minor pseudopilin GspH [Oxalicibacterium sp.]